MIEFSNWYFLLLIPLIIAVFFYLSRRNKSAMKFSSVRLLMAKGMKKTFIHKIGSYLIVLGLILASIALARPHIKNESAVGSQSGVDIAIVLDVSLSMQSIDFKPNRLEVAKKTIDEFIMGRPSDRFALVVFKATAHTLIPLTVDHNILKNTIADVGDESVIEDGTAIGMAISVGLNRLKDSDAVSKVIILVTDGENNSGAIDPRTATEMARDLGIKIYTVGVGTDKTMIPYETPTGIEYEIYDTGIDDELLTFIADTTGGEYYRASKANSLSGIFSDIGDLEKTEFEQGIVFEYTELGFGYIKAALILLALGIFLDRFLFVRIP